MNRRDRTLFALGLMGSVPLAIVLLALSLVLGWPVLFMPWIWREYSCWETDE